MNRVLAIASAVLADAIRRKVVWVVGIFAALMALVIPSLPSYGAGVVTAIFREVSIALMYTASLVVAVTLAATRIPAEVERRTVFNILARDVRRWQYVFGTWLGMFGVVGAVIAGFTVICCVVAFAVYRDPMFVLLQASVAVWFEMGVIVAFTVFMSTRMGTVTSVVGAGAFAFVGHSVSGLVLGPAEFVRVNPWWLPSLDTFDVINQVSHGGGYGLGYAASMTVVFCAWVALLMVLASAVFEGRDL